MKTRFQLQRPTVSIADQIRAALLVATALAASAHGQVLPPDATVEGRTIGQWSGECWKWIWSISTNQSPLLDCTGKWANNRQPDSTVFFVAPVNGLTPPPCTRTFTVPEEKFILLPVLAVALDNIDTVPPLTIEQMHDSLNAVLDEPADLHASIDGVTVDNLHQYRATSPPLAFDFPEPGDNILTVNYQHPIVGLVDPIIPDGYWLMLEPLPPGPHVLRTGGQLSQVIFFPHEIICNITVITIPLSVRVQGLIRLTQDSKLPGNRLQPLLASLASAKASFESTNLIAGVNQLNAFQNKVRAQVARTNPELANQLDESAQRIIDKAFAQLQQPAKSKK